MTPSPLKLLLVDSDPIFRLGLRAAFDAAADLEVVAEADSNAAALAVLDRLAGSVAEGAEIAVLDLVLIALNPTEERAAIAAENTAENASDPIAICRHLHDRHPDLPAFLLATHLDRDRLDTARVLGVRGFCLKGAAWENISDRLHRIAAGESFWENLDALAEAEPSKSTSPPAPSPKRSRPSPRWQQQWRTLSLRHFDRAQSDIRAKLRQPGLSLPDRLFFQGRQRELRVARQCIEFFLGKESPASKIDLRKSADNLPAPEPFGPVVPVKPIDPTAIALATTDTDRPIARDWQTALLDGVLEKLQSNLANLTETPLEIDIFRPDRKRELIYIIVRQFEEALEELRYSQVQSDQLHEKIPLILRDLWSASIVEFYGRYYTIETGNEEIEIASFLQRDREIVQAAILEKIPLVFELLSHLLFQTPLSVENAEYPAGSSEAMTRSEALLQNLFVSIANSTVQPLLNHFSDIESIKQKFYDRRILSTREIERFRNSLSWKYRLEKYVEEPKAMFESKHYLWTFDRRGIKQTAIYFPRRQEFEKLTGIRRTLTYVLEARDAIAPRLQSIISSVGSGVVYVLTQVVGRGIGLIGKGVLQGIGSSWQNSNFRSPKNEK